MEKKRSVGVTVYGIIAIILGSLFILQSLMVIIGLPVVLTKTQFKPDTSPWSMYIIQIIGFLYSVFFLISGIGMLKLKSWGRKNFLWLLSIPVFLMVLPFIMLLVTGKMSLIQIIIKNHAILFVMCFYAITLYYFTRPKVKEQFK